MLSLQLSLDSNKNATIESIKYVMMSGLDKLMDIYNTKMMLM
jgi:hypothetical protein